MSIQWNESAPIYRQLRDYVKAMILDEALKEGDALPSVKNWLTSISSKSVAALVCT